eukprot:3333044-Heterocapsa_arctica.AAC.1
MWPERSGSLGGEFVRAHLRHQDARGSHEGRGQQFLEQARTAGSQKVAAEAVKAEQIPGAVEAPGPGAAIGSSIRG